MHRWRKLQDGSELLVTGANNKVFPIPLKKNEAGQWYFDIAAGKEEILARRAYSTETVKRLFEESRRLSLTVEAESPILPPLWLRKPTWSRPRIKVPVVITTVSA